RLAGYGDAAQVTDDLREGDYGIYEGRTTAEIGTVEPGWSVWTSSIAQGEAVEQVGERTRRVIDRAAAAPGHVARLPPGQGLRSLSAGWLGLPARDGRLLALGPAAISVLGYEHATRVISVWNQGWRLAPEQER